MAEQVRALRIRASGLAVHLSAAGKRIDCSAENISRTGLFARTAAEVREGTSVRIDVVRPGWKQALRLAGSVVRRAGPQSHQGRGVPGVGIAFDPLDEQMQMRLQRALVELRVAGRSSATNEQAAPPTPDPAGLEYFERRCADLKAELARREEEVARLKVELQAARARLRAIDVGPGSPNPKD